MLRRLLLEVTAPCCCFPSLPAWYAAYTSTRVTTKHYEREEAESYCGVKVLLCVRPAVLCSEQRRGYSLIERKLAPTATTTAATEPMDVVACGMAPDELDSAEPDQAVMAPPELPVGPESDSELWSPQTSSRLNLRFGRGGRGRRAV
jgi:hypothetical protein